MPLTPPERWSTGNPLRRLRLSEAFITQTYGGAAGDVVTSMEFPTPTASNDKTGTVTGTASASGTVVGAKATTGTVVGTTTNPAGVVTGKHGGLGTVVGTTPNPTAAASGTKAATGTVVGTATVTGTATGTAEGGVTPPPAESGGNGGGYYAPKFDYRQPQPTPVVTKSGSVSATIPAPQGTARGQRGAAGAIRSSVRCDATAAGKRGATARVDARVTYLRSTVTGQPGQRDHEYLALYAEMRRQQDDADLLLML